MNVICRNKTRYINFGLPITNLVTILYFRAIGHLYYQSNNQSYKMYNSIYNRNIKKRSLKKKLHVVK